MKKRMIKVLLTLTAGTLITGCNTMKVTDTTEQRIDNIQLEQTVTRNTAFNNVEIYYTQSKKDFESLRPVLTDRQGKIIIEVLDGTVLDDDGNGVDNCGYYQYYDSDRFTTGDRVKSVFVYNPDNNYVDDILYRIDIKA